MVNRRAKVPEQSGVTFHITFLPSITLLSHVGWLVLLHSRSD